MDSWARAGRQFLGQNPNVKWELMQESVRPGVLWQSRRESLAVLERLEASWQPAELEKSAMARSWACPGFILAPTRCLYGGPRAGQGR